MSSSDECGLGDGRDAPGPGWQAIGMGDSRAGNSDQFNEAVNKVTLNSTAPWHLTGVKAEEFARVLRTTPTL
jgi:hypothetical protein